MAGLPANCYTLPLPFFYLFTRIERQWGEGCILDPFYPARDTRICTKITTMLNELNQHCDCEPGAVMFADAELIDPLNHGRG